MILKQIFNTSKQKKKLFSLTKYIPKFWFKKTSSKLANNFEKTRERIFFKSFKSLHLEQKNKIKRNGWSSSNHDL